MVNVKANAELPENEAMQMAVNEVRSVRRHIRHRCQQFQVLPCSESLYVTGSWESSSHSQNQSNILFRAKRHQVFSVLCGGRTSACPAILPGYCRVSFCGISHCPL